MGFANLDQGSNNETNMPDNVIQGCIAWQPQIQTRTFDGDVSTHDYYSSAAIVGFTATHNYLTDCLRRSDMDFRDYSGNMVLYDQANASPSTPLVVSNPNPSVYKHYYPYHGPSTARFPQPHGPWAGTRRFGTSPAPSPTLPAR